MHKRLRGVVLGTSQLRAANQNHVAQRKRTSPGRNLERYPLRASLAAVVIHHRRLKNVLARRRHKMTLQRDRVGRCLVKIPQCSAPWNIFAESLYYRAGVVFDNG